MKRLAGLLGLIAVAACSLLYYSWSQATKLPDWYTAQQNLNNLKPQRVQAQTKSVPEELTDKINATIAANPTGSKNLQVSLGEQEFTDLIVAAVSEDVASQEILKAVKGVNTEIKDGKLSSGVVINLSEIPTDQLQGTSQAVVKNVIQTFPFVKDKEIYLGIEGTPQIASGALKLDPNTQVKLGSLSFKLSALADRLGVSQAALEQSIHLNLGQFKVDQIEFQDSNALIQGSVK